MARRITMEGNMDPKNLSRRDLLARGLQVSAVGVAAVAIASCDQSNTPKVEACAGPNNLTFSENSLRQASHYVEQSPHADKKCNNCGFFTPGEGGSPCGKCEIFLGPVNAQGHCDSWAEKKA
jgi:hypothetical protein